VKILVVDDARLQRELMLKMVEGLGHSVLLAADGEEAVEMARRERPDLILMDIMMPNKNGYQAAREITRGPDEDWIPIIFLSVSEGDQDLEMAIASGGSDYLVKPVSRAVLGAKIASMQRIGDMRQRQMDLSQQLALAYSELEVASQRDGLTGVSNRGNFDAQLEKEMGRARRSRSPLSVVLADVDFFKRYNDHYGHPAGDACLRRVAQALQSACRRPADFVARYGGEEFALLLPETPAEGARLVAEAAREAVLSCAIPHAPAAGAQHVSISAGVATAAAGDDSGPQRLIAAADAALYRAKDLGRNRVVAADLRPFS
jgi:diguanylate cyclase (GGDEF)-like protein